MKSANSKQEGYSSSQIYELCRYTLAIIFMGSGLIPLLLNDSVQRLALLHNFPFPESWHQPLFYSLVLLDVCCGIWVLLKPSRVIAGILIFVVIGYTLTMTLFTPEIWQDPFSGMLKNIAIIAMSWIILKLDCEVRHV